MSPAALRRLGHHVEVWEDRPSRVRLPGRPRARLRRRMIPASPGRPCWRRSIASTSSTSTSPRRSFRAAWSGLPPFWDLPLYRALGKRVFFTFHGTDVRIARIHDEVHPWSPLRVTAAPAEDDRTEKALEVIRTYADRLFVVSVNYLHFLPQAEYLPRDHRPRRVAGAGTGAARAAGHRARTDAARDEGHRADPRGARWPRRGGCHVRPASPRGPAPRGRAGRDRRGRHPGGQRHRGFVRDRLP